MANAEPPAPGPASAWARGRRDFRRWRRGRPFWGAFVMALAGLELFASANLDLTELQIHVGTEGFLSYLLPALLVVTAVLAASVRASGCSTRSSVRSPRCTR